MGLKEILEPMEASGKVIYEDGETNVDETPAEIRGEEITGTPEDASKQPVPSDTMCPYCGSEPTDESVRDHQLSAIGYIHDDIHLECAECERNWACGVPIGEVDDGYSEYLFCDSCEKRHMRIHRVVPKWDDPGQQKVLLHLKCPNCFYFDKALREADEDGILLIGHPDITGSRDGADEFGWEDN